MRKIYKYPLAEQDLIDIWLYGYTTWGLAQADRYTENLEQQIGRLAVNPEICRAHPEFVPPVRICPSGSHLIVYTTDDARLTIVRVLHRRMDISNRL